LRGFSQAVVRITKNILFNCIAIDSIVGQFQIFRDAIDLADRDVSQINFGAAEIRFPVGAIAWFPHPSRQGSAP
jgi:hypothetical protein